MADDQATQEIQANFDQQFHQNAKRVDQIFACLMLLQFVGCMVAAIVVTPRTWAGTAYSTHFHVWVSILFGGVLALPTAYSGWYHGGARLNRYAFAIAQALFSTLIIHISGGRIESHFHIFGSIAFLAAYRDPGSVIVATVVVAVDHFARGLMWPGSIFGVDVVSIWRPIEHACWVIFEDVIILLTIFQMRQGMWSLATHMQQESAQQTTLRADLDHLRVAIAAAADGDLSVDVVEGQRTETQLLSHDVRRMIADMRSMIATINQQSHSVRQSADGFVNRTELIRDALQTQLGSMGSIDDAMQTMQTTIADIQTSIDLASQAKTEAREQATLSEAAIAASERTMSDLQESSQRIDSIVEEIQEIAEQTSLLSLNATIEAARAGDSGKGFAVVANEVKDLASKSNVAANSISELIRESLECVNEGVAASRETTAQFRKILEAVQAIDERIADVVQSTSRQAEQTKHVESLVRSVLLATSESSESCQSVSVESEKFRQIAEDLDQHVNRFNLGPESSVST